MALCSLASSTPRGWTASGRKGLPRRNRTGRCRWTRRRSLGTPSLAASRSRSADCESTPRRGCLIRREALCAVSTQRANWSAGSSGETTRAARALWQGRFSGGLPGGTRRGRRPRELSDLRAASCLLADIEIPRLHRRYASTPSARTEGPARELGGTVGLTLDVRKLLRDFAVADAEDVDAADVAGLALAVDPVIDPADGAAVAAGEDVLAVEASVWGGREEPFPEATNAVLACEALTVRGWVGVLEHAVVGHEGHDGVDVVAVEGLVESMD